MSDALERFIRDPAAAKALGSPPVAMLLRPFMQRAYSLTEASQVLEVPLPRLHYWVQRFVQFGVLEIVREQARTGKPIKFYAATAQRFFVPSQRRHQSHFVNHEAMWINLFYTALERAAPSLLHSGGLAIQLDTEGNVNLLSLGESGQPWDPLAPDHPAVLNMWSGSLILEPATAKQLQQELMELFQRFAAQKDDTEGQSYLLHIGMAPQPER